MKLDEFAFFNQQLAAMVREGIPLEGALRQLCSNLQRGELRSEVEALEDDLARGVPLPTAIAARRFPELYRRVVSAGAKGQDLAGFLTRMADHYHEQHLLWTRMKGLMTYPVLVLAGIFGLSLLAFLVVRELYGGEARLFDMLEGVSLPVFTQLCLPLLVHAWVFPLAFGLLLAGVLTSVILPNLRNAVLWRLPAFREASLARISDTLALLLERSVPLPEAMALVEDLESNQVAAIEIRRWRERLAQGVTELTQVTAGGRFFPPLFTWLAVNAGAGLADGFRRAAAIYRARATARTEILMHAALPVAVLVLGTLVAVQAVVMLSLFLPFITLMDQLGG